MGYFWLVGKKFWNLHLDVGPFLLFILIRLCFGVGNLLKGEQLPKEEENFQKVYVKAPSFLSIHMGVKAEVLPPDTDCHHFVLEVQ